MGCGVITAPWGVWGARAPQYYYTIYYPYITPMITPIITLMITPVITPFGGESINKVPQVVIPNESGPTGNIIGVIIGVIIG